MNKKDWVEGLLFAGLRLISTGCIVAGVVGILFQLTVSWDAFDPSYLGPFLAATVLRPAILIATGVVIHLLSGRMARRMAYRFTHS